MFDGRFVDGMNNATKEFLGRIDGYERGKLPRFTMNQILREQTDIATASQILLGLLVSRLGLMEGRGLSPAFLN